MQGNILWTEGPASRKRSGSILRGYGPGSAVLLEGAGNAPDFHGFDAALEQLAAAGVHGAAGGDHVIDQGDPAPVPRGSVAECAAQVVQALPAAETGLGTGGACPDQAAVVHRFVQSPGQLPGDQQGLIESAFEQPFAVQGHRHQYIHFAVRQFTPQARGEGIGNHQAFTELELQQQAACGSSEHQWCPQTLPGWRAVSAAGAEGFALRCGQPAKNTGLWHAGQTAPAVIAKVVMRPRIEPAQQTIPGIDPAVEEMADIEFHRG